MIVDFNVNRINDSARDFEGSNRFDINYRLLLCPYYRAQLIVICMSSFSKTNWKEKNFTKRVPKEIKKQGLNKYSFDCYVPLFTFS